MILSHWYFRVIPRVRFYRIFESLFNDEKKYTVKNRRSFLKDSLYLAGALVMANPFSDLLNTLENKAVDKEIKFRLKLKSRLFGIKIGEKRGKNYLSIRSLSGGKEKRVFTFEPGQIERIYKKDLRKNTLSFESSGKLFSVSLDRNRFDTDFPGASFPDPVPPQGEILGILAFLVVAVVAICWGAYISEMVKGKPKSSGFMLEPGLEEEPTVWY